MILDELKKQFSQTGNTVIKLIIVNVGIFVVFGLIGVLTDLLGVQLPVKSFTEYLALSDDLGILLQRPWTLISSAFGHWSIGHLFFNMLGLFFVGNYFAQEIGDRKLLSLYLLGGLGASIFYLLVQNTIPFYAQIPSVVVGASGSVVAITIALATFYPQRQVMLFFVLPVKFFWLGIGLVVMYVLSITGDNAGGEIGHLGGAITGFLFAYYHKKGTDITKPIGLVIGLIEGVFEKRPVMKTSYRKPTAYSKKEIVDVDFKEISQDEIDAILDKLKRSGYASLTEKEKRTLFEYSKQ